MEPPPLVIVTSSKSLSTRRALKAIEAFLEANEAAKLDTSDSAISRNRISAIPEHIVLSLHKVKTLIKEKIVLSSSSAVKDEFADSKNGKRSFSDLEKFEATPDVLIKVEKEDHQQSKKLKKSAEGEKNLSEKKKKSRI